ncbi:hypothetical protein [Nocardioides sp. Leaf285]|uniref:hypothetical protein n=1 Tax=Nocardioides sp. Leaf285 TaxID=1736322 RepID=UPI000702933F|nr:hypothetical protein [Nocardioides sp. Leaf285]KQP62975.1 hypothetical protein ASF47_18355 [Nocardioides sp. Leaf285]
MKRSAALAVAATLAVGGAVVGCATTGDPATGARTPAQAYSDFASTALPDLLPQTQSALAATGYACLDGTEQWAVVSGNDPSTLKVSFGDGSCRFVAEPDADGSVAGSRAAVVVQADAAGDYRPTSSAPRRLAGLADAVAWAFNEAIDRAAGPRRS